MPALSPVKQERVGLGDSRMGTKENNVGFEVFTAVVFKSIVFWDMTPCSPLSYNRHFGGTYRLRP
jgi:hypothetical protein